MPQVMETYISLEHSTPYIQQAQDSHICVPRYSRPFLEQGAFQSICHFESERIKIALTKSSSKWGFLV